MNKIKNNFEQEVLQRTLKNIRSRNNIMQTDLAGKLGLPQSFVSKYECGDRRLDIVELRAVCKALKITLIYFVKEYEENLNQYESK